MTDKPHNNFFVYAFSQKEIAKDFLTQLTTDIAAEINIDTLELDGTSYVNKELDDLYSDIVYNVETKTNEPIKISLLFEHKSTPPKYPRLQLMDYLLGIWRTNIKDKQPLRTVIPIIFYHGQQKWKYKEFQNHFKNISETIQAYLPKFDYRLVNLADYPDEFILSLKKGFLINSLIAFKHKNDGNYVKQYFTNIFANLEEIASTELGRNFLHHLAVYIIIATKLKAKEVLELSDKLPKNTKNTVMTTYDNLIEYGKKQGLEEGVKNSLLTVIRLLDTDLTLDIISEAANIPIKIVKLFKANIDNNYASMKMKKELVTLLIIKYSILSNENVAKFSKLETSEIQELRNQLKDLK